jgi:hypothetical protein
MRARSAGSSSGRLGARDQMIRAAKAPHPLEIVDKKRK